MVVSKLTPIFSRKWALAAIMMMAGATMGITGVTSTFVVLAALRTLHGAINSASNPFTYSLVADSFSKDSRPLVNSMIHSGQYIGQGLSSLSIIAIGAFGWQRTFLIMGVLSVVLSALIVALIEEPIRGKFLSQKERED